jgi:hypothetical protein
MSHELKDKNFFGEDLNENGEIGPPVTWTTASDPRWIAAKETYHRLTNNHNASLNATMYKVFFLLSLYFVNINIFTDFLNFRFSSRTRGGIFSSMALTMFFR